MARNKQNQKQKKDGNHRRETKDEKKARLQSQQEAREYCEKILPYVLGAVVVFLLVFGIYVHSVPPKEVVVPDPVSGGDSVPPIDLSSADPMLKEALDEASEALNQAASPPAEDEGETVEL